MSACVTRVTHAITSDIAEPLAVPLRVFWWGLTVVSGVSISTSTPVHSKSDGSYLIRSLGLQAKWRPMSHPHHHHSDATVSGWKTIYLTYILLVLSAPSGPWTAEETRGQMHACSRQRHRQMMTLWVTVTTPPGKVHRISPVPWPT